MKFTTLGIIIILVALTVLGTIYSRILFGPKADSGSSSTITVSSEEQVFHSSDRHMPDYPYLTVPTNSGLIGVFSIGQFANQRAYKVSSPMGSTLGNPSPIAGIIKGTRRSDPDWGGVWLAATYRHPNSNIIDGIYHAETHTGTGAPNLTNDVWTGAYIRSTDGGETWEKPNHPNNVLITAVGNPQEDGADVGYLIPRGTDAYLYYFENTKNSYRGTSLAKAPLNSLGNPNSWKKYYCQQGGSCGFTEPGIGGKSTPLPGMDGKSPVIFNTHLNKFIGMSGWPMTRDNKLQFYASENGINFTKFGQEINLGASTFGQDFVPVYHSLIGTDGSMAQTGRQFYLYYVLMKWNRNTQQVTDPNRYLMRRLITFPATGTPTPTNTPTATPTQTPTPTPTPRPSPTPTPTPRPSPTPTKTPTPSPTPRRFTCARPGDSSCFDCNTDGAISILDFSCFRSAYGSQIGALVCKIAGDKACSNCNTDQVINILDFSCFAKNYNKTY